MKRILNCLTQLFIATLVCSNIYAQSESTTEYSGLLDTYYKRGPIQFIAGGGLASFRGDANKPYNFKSASPHFTVGAAYQWFPYTTFVTELSMINVNFDFINPEAKLEVKNIEFNIHSRIYLLYNRVTRKSQTMKGRFFQPYVLAGLGANRYTATYTVGDISTGDTKPKYAFVLPYGLGAKFRINNKFNVLAEVSRRSWLSGKDVGSILKGYNMASVKVQFNPWGAKQRKTKKRPAPTTPTHFYSPDGVGPNNQRRKEELEGAPVYDDDEEYEDYDDEEGEEEEDTETEEEENPFEEFEGESKEEEEDPFDW